MNATFAASYTSTPTTSRSGATNETATVSSAARHG